MKTACSLRKLLPLGLFLCLLISCSGCESDLATGQVVIPGEANSEVVVEDPPAEGFAPFAVATLALVNEVRSEGCKCGSRNMPAVSPLALHPQLNVAAQAHSDDQAAMRRMQHAGSDGSKVGVRVNRAGFSWRTVGENVAWNYPDVEAVVAGWLSSPGHCENMMNANFAYMGMGETDLYWTQVLAR